MNIAIDAIRNAVKEAGKRCEAIRRGLVKEETLEKRDKSPVTIADYTVQAMLCRAIRELDPGVSIVAEEDSRMLREARNRPMLEKIAEFLTEESVEAILEAIDAGGGTPGAAFIAVDPVDGTLGFLRGGQYAVAVAAIENGKVLWGVLGCPNWEIPGSRERGAVVSAERGRPARLESVDGRVNETLRVTHTAFGGPVRFLESVEAGHADHARQEGLSRAAGPKASIVRVDSQVKYAMLARGDAEVYLRLPTPGTPGYKDKISDHAAGALIVECAGGKVTDMYGNPLDFTAGKTLARNTGVIATNGIAHDAVLSRIG